MTTVAVDLLGGDGAPEVVADAICSIVSAGDDISLIVVGPEPVARELLEERGIRPDSVRFADAPDAVGMAGNPLADVRDRDDVTVAVATDLVSSGDADAWVSVGHTGAAVAAAVLRLGRIPGMARPALAVVVPALAGPVVLVDAGAGPDATPDVLRQFALAGWAYARALGHPAPVVGLLSIGSEAGKGDRMRASAHELFTESLAGSGVPYAGPVEGHDLAIGERAQVVVTDGFTGNVLLKGLEGAVRWSAARMGAAYGDSEPARAVVRGTATSDFAGGMLLGVTGITVIGHGAGTPDEICACVRLAARASRTGLVESTRAVLATVMAGRA